jgi:uncharacterized membrane protein YozB (DUF420 family)
MASGDRANSPDGWLRWTPCPSRAKLLGAHDGNHSSRSQHRRSGGRDGAARRLVIGALTAIVIGGVAIVIYVPHGGHAGGSSWLINASLNGTATILLGTGYVLIRRRRIAAHRTCMIAAFAASSLFLITYLIHHARVGSVPFHGAAWLRPVYFGLLVPHIVLAALVLPLALTTIYRAWCPSTVTSGSRV